MYSIQRLVGEGKALDVVTFSMMKGYVFHLVCFLSFTGLTASIENPVEYVLTLGGTDSRYDLSHGNVLPLIARPWSFNTWSPMTDNSDGSWWFHPYDVSFYGIRCTHQPSPWISDYGQFTVSGNMIDPKHQDVSQFSAFDPSKSVFKPYHFKADLLAYGTSESYTTIEVTSTSHGAIVHIQFPSFEDDSDFNQTRRVIVGLNGGSDDSSIGTLDDGAIAITGTSRANSGGIPNHDLFGHHFVVGFYGGEDGSKPIGSEHILASSASSSAAWVDFKAESDITSKITLRIATSFISYEQALTTLAFEVPTDLSFEEMLSSSRDEWNEVLSRASVDAVPSSYTEEQAEDLLVTFYSSLYRASLFPRQLSELDAEGNTVHWSPFSSQDGPFQGPISTDSGFWDAYSTVYPLLSLVNVPVLATTLQGWVNAYKEGGWLPKWASPGYRGSMVGTMGDVSLADAIVKGIPGFDKDGAYEAIRKDAFEPPPPSANGMGRECLATYLKFGYIPHGTCSEVVSRTLDYLQADYAIANAAELLGYADDATTLRSRAANYSSMFDFSSGFMRSIDLATGKFTEPFDQFAWGGDYTEAGPWQYRFSLPYDAPGLANMYRDADMDICSVLEQTQTMASIYHIGDYSNQIHEMTEMAVNCWGQYEHNNQPVHHILYMFGAVDPSAGYGGACAARGQYYLRKAMRELYKPNNNMFAGDEDNGEMGAWYVLSALGLYSLSPGTEDYVFGSPLFEKVTINLEGNGRQHSMSTPTLVIEAVDNTAENVYVQSVSWNGQAVSLDSNSISYSELMKGGTLQFVMGSQPLH